MLSLERIHELLDPTRTAECVKEATRLIDILQSTWVTKTTKKAMSSKYDSKLSPFDKIAGLPQEGREPYPNTRIAVNKHNTQARQSNAILDDYRYWLNNRRDGANTNMSESQSQPEHRRMVGYIFLVLLCLVPDAVSVFPIDNIFVRGVDEDEDDASQTNSVTCGEFSLSLIDRMEIYALRGQTQVAAALERTKLQFYLQCTRSGICP